MENQENEREELLESFVVYDEEGNELELYVVDQTKVAGVDYLLATDTQEDGGNGYIFKMEYPEDGSDDVLLNSVDEADYDYIAGIFAEQNEIEFTN